MTVTTTPEAATTDETAPVFEKGSWQHTLQLSVQAEDKSKSAKELAGKRLWLGAREAVKEFLDSPGADADALFNQAKATGLSAVTASKIKKVAITARDHAFDEETGEGYNWEVLASLPYGAGNGKISLGKADKMARDLADVPEVEAAEDDAVEATITALTETAPKTSTTVEGMLQIALVKAGDIEEFVKVLIDVLNGPTGEHNEAACRSFIRAFSTENGGRVKAAKPQPVTVAQRNAEKRAASTPGDGAAKAKPAPVKTKPVPVQTDKTKTALPPKTKAAPVTDTTDAAVDGAEADGDMLDAFDDLDTDATEVAEAPVATKPAPVKAKPVKKATPIKRA